MKVNWTENAIEHLVTIYEYIALNSPIYAKRMVDQITRRSEQIVNHPLSGRKVPEYDVEDICELIEKALSDHLPDKAGSNRRISCHTWLMAFIGYYPKAAVMIYFTAETSAFISAY